MSCVNQLEDVLPYFTVIERVAPSHLHGSDNDVLFEDVRAELPVHLLALFQGDLENPQHEGQDGAWMKQRQVWTCRHIWGDYTPTVKKMAAYRC